MHVNPWNNDQGNFNVAVAATAFTAAFDLKKSNTEIRKQLILPGALQINGEKITDPNGLTLPVAGDTLRLSKKHLVRIV